MFDLVQTSVGTKQLWSYQLSLNVNDFGCNSQKSTFVLCFVILNPFKVSATNRFRNTSDYALAEAEGVQKTRPTSISNQSDIKVESWESSLVVKTLVPCGLRVTRMRPLTLAHYCHITRSDVITSHGVM